MSPSRSKYIPKILDVSWQRCPWTPLGERDTPYLSRRGRSVFCEKEECGMGTWEWWDEIRLFDQQLVTPKESFSTVQGWDQDCQALESMKTNPKAQKLICSFTTSNFYVGALEEGLISFPPLSRSGEARHPLRAGQEGGHQDHQQGQADRVRAAEGGEGDRHHEAHRAPQRARAIRRLREQEIPVSQMESTLVCISTYSVCQKEILGIFFVKSNIMVN